MKLTVLVASAILASPILHAQSNLEVDGNIKVGNTPKDNTADSLLVRLTDGTLGIRDAASLTQYQVLSISNDTIFLENSGFIKLPATFDGQYSSLTGAPVDVSFFTNDAGYISTEIDASITNEIQTISRSGLEVTLSGGGGTFMDSINVYSAGAGIAIDHNIISNILIPGETNTGVNVGTGGVGIFKQKTNHELEFKQVNAGSDKVTITDDTEGNEVDIDIVETNINIANLSGAPSSSVVGVSDAQTITNKIISATTNTISGLTPADVGLNSTDDLPEGANLYYTDDRFDTRFISKSTTDVMEGANLYYTDTRADNRINVQKGTMNGLATLDGSGKVPSSQLSLTSVSYQGQWDASANTPALVDGIGTQGNYYVVSNEGTTIVDGIAEWHTGDWIVFNGNVWQKADHSDQVTSVAGKQGVVTLVSSDIIDLSTSNVAEGSNLYYTDTRFDTRLAIKSTSDITEGANLYYTDARVNNNSEVIANSTHRILSDNPHAVTKSQVGLGNVENTKVKLDATSAPTSADDETGGYSIGSRWIDITHQREYVCVDATGTVAIWKETINHNQVYLGQDTLGGIVYHTYKGTDGQDHGLIVAKVESIAKWQSTSTLLNADRSWDGFYNMGLMEEDQPGPPLAKDAVQVLGPEWYLPSIDELILLWNNRFYVNKALHTGGHTLLSNLDYYWSSTEHNAANALAFLFNGYTDLFDKTSNLPKVRAIRAF